MLIIDISLSAFLSFSRRHFHGALCFLSFMIDTPFSTRRRRTSPFRHFAADAMPPPDI